MLLYKTYLISKSKDKIIEKLLAFILFIMLLLNPVKSTAQVLQSNFVFEGITRSYTVFLPQNYNGVDKLPLVLNLHGYTLNMTQQMNYSRMNQVADTAGFIVVYPDAVSAAWNAGIAVTAGHVNDVGFIDALIDTLAAHYSIDEERIYSCGFSLGGFMSHRLACQLSNRITAIADVAGTIAQGLTSSYTTLHQMPILKIHGTNDQIVLYNGEADWSSVQQTLNYWMQFNHCNSPDTIPMPNIDTLDGCTVQKIRYSFSSASGEIVLYKILSGGHSWSSGDTAHFQWLSLGPIGKTNMDINASEIIWDFFKNYNLTDLCPLCSVRFIKPYLNKTYAKVNTDSVLFRIRISNNKNLQFTSYLIYSNSDGSELDSLRLYDDGLHGDSLANDDLYAVYIPLISNEDFYTLSISVTENQTENYLLQSLYNDCKFTTAGPITLDSLTYRKGLLNYHYIRPFVHNWGSSKTISNASIRFTSNDPWVTVSGGSVPLPDISAGTTVGATGWVTLQVIDSIFPGHFNFNAEIMIDDQVYWIDSTTRIIVTGVEDEVQQPLAFKLEQNFPNPFNATTTIGFGIPEKGNVKLYILNILGEEIKVLLNEEKEAGYHSVDFIANDLTSGVYFYKLQAGSFVDTKKMILLK